MKKIILMAVLATLLISEVSGCGTLKKKFTPRKKEPEAPRVYYELEKYEKEPNLVLYQKHYVFWKTWHEELINKIGEKRDSDIRCAEEIIINLGDMKKLLVEEKARGLGPYIDEMQKIKKELDNRFLTLGDNARIKKTLERRYREIKKEFSDNKIKDYILTDEQNDTKTPDDR